SKKFQVYAVFITKMACDNCVIDPSSKASTGIYNNTGPQPFTARVCPVCLGNGSLASSRRIKLQATVEWSSLTKADENRPLPQGEIPYAHALIKVLTADEATLLRAAHFLIDGIRYVRKTESQTTGLMTKALSRVLVKRED
ncbi:MAG: hypothetical protein FWD53_12575, partial [Phycisphaerales bacterium]|nr:hypothetical protein [Phycisphaerales bacterium]